MVQCQHLSVEEYGEIMLMLHDDTNVAEIARSLGRSRPIVLREVRRNSFRVGARRY